MKSQRALFTSSNNQHTSLLKLLAILLGLHLAIDTDSTFTNTEIYLEDVLQQDLTTTHMERFMVDPTQRLDMWETSGTYKPTIKEMEDMSIHSLLLIFSVNTV